MCGGGAGGTKNAGREQTKYGGRPGGGRPMAGRAGGGTDERMGGCARTTSRW